MQLSGENFCIHCGLAIPRSWRERYESDISKLRFCCAGCECVYQIINGLGLSEFYDIKQRLPPDTPIPANPTKSKFDYFGDSEFQEEYVEKCAGDLSRVKLFLEGVHCAACVWLIERLPLILAGVREARLNYADRTATIVYDAKTVSLQQIARTLNSIGYVPHPQDHSALAEERQIERRRLLLRLGVAAVCSGNTMMVAVSMYQGWFSGIAPKYLSFFQWFSLLVALPAVVYSAQPFYRAALGGLRAQMFHIDLPISLGILGGFSASAFNTMRGGQHVYYDSICVLIFLLLLGRLLQRIGVDKAIQQSEAMYQLSPKVARRRNSQGVEEVFVNAIVRGDVLEVRPGDVFAADGILIEGETRVDRSVLTGESRAIRSVLGDVIYAGTRNLQSTVLLRVDAITDQSRIGKLLLELQDAASRKTTLVQLTDKIAGWFVATVLVLTVFCFAYWFHHVDLATAIDCSLALLVISCPCALGLAAPISLSIAIRTAAKRGIFIKGAETIERLYEVESVFIDKTGTITSGEPNVHRHHLSEQLPVSQEECFHRAAMLEEANTHPLAGAIRRYVLEELEFSDLPKEGLHDLEEVGGSGISGRDAQQHLWRIGSVSWLQRGGLVLKPSEREFFEAAKLEGLSPVALAYENTLCVLFAIGDTIKPGAREFVTELKAMGKECYILSGDYAEIVASVANEVGVSSTRAFGELSPEQKTAKVSASGASSVSLMIGDGVNDAAALAAADVGIAVQGGAEASLRTADIFVNSKQLGDTLWTLKFARTTVSVIKRNLLFSLLYNVVGASLAVTGQVSPLLAAVLMPISSLTVVLSSLSLCRKS